MIVVFVKIMLVVVVAEAAVMLALAMLPEIQSIVVEALVDALALGCLTSPLIYFWLIRPLAQRLTATLDSLNEARSKAEAANRAKSAFLANMSHEIRTPMTAILGYANVLLEDCVEQRGPAACVDAIRTIQRNGELLLDVINDILDLSKIDAGHMSIEQIACSPRQILLDTLKLMQLRATSKGLYLEVVGAESLPNSLESDPTRLRQILVNIIGNAIKFTAAGSIRVEARWLCDSNICSFDVVDTGIGITAEQSARLFQVFSQADNSATRLFGGTGLGLAISKHLARLLGGDLTLIESQPGRGSRFRLSIAAPPPRFDRRPGSTPEPASAATDALPSGVRVLLAEDGPDNQRLIERLLTRAGAEVSIVDNGQAAVEALWSAEADEQPYDVVLMDMQMPQLDGYEATALLRSRGYRGRIVALTAHAMASDRQRCLSAGCDGYLTKPLQRHLLIAQVALHARAAQADRLLGHELVPTDSVVTSAAVIGDFDHSPPYQTPSD